MRYCPNCGSELADGVRFCINCGQDQQPPVSAPRKNVRKAAGSMHCPQCKSGDISPIVETDITGGTSFNHSFSKRNSVSAMQFNNTHRNYWMCSNCGCKFRNLQNLEEELKNTQGIVKRGMIGVILLIVLCLLFTMTIGFSVFSVLCIIVVSLCAIAIVILRKRISDMQQEQVYLKKNCFD